MTVVRQFKTTTFNSKKHKLETKTYLTWFFTCKSYLTAENNLMHWFALNLVFTCKCIMNVIYMFCLLYAKYFKWQLLSRVRTFCSNLSYFKYTILVCSKPNCCAASWLNQCWTMCNMANIDTSKSGSVVFGGINLGTTLKFQNNYNKTGRISGGVIFNYSQ